MRDGVDSPGQTVDAPGVRYELDEVCQPCNCPGSDISVSFVPGRKGRALSVRDGAHYRFLGRVREILKGCGATRSRRRRHAGS
jgi:hypothetical protein